MPRLNLRHVTEVLVRFNPLAESVGVREFARQASSKKMAIDFPKARVKVESCEDSMSSVIEITYSEGAKQSVSADGLKAKDIIGVIEDMNSQIDVQRALKGIADD